MKILSKVSPMTIKLLSSQVALVAMLACLITAGLDSKVLAQGGPGQPNVSADEENLAKAITSAPDAAAKLKAAAELIKKHPKTTLRPRVARALVDQIAGVTDATQKITFAQEYLGIFKEPSEQQLIMPVLIGGYAAAKRPDEAFSTGSEFLTRSPDSLDVLIMLVSVGTELAKQKNVKFVPQTLQYGAHAIELIEGDKKPADMDDAGWKQYKTSMLPAVYQSMGLLNLVKGDHAEAKARYAKAAELAPRDPFNYVMLGGILNDEYESEAKHYKGMPDGQAKQDNLKKVQGMLDELIDVYARAIALSEGNATLEQVRQQYLQDIEAYYKYRHNNSTAGMQQLIDKYKVAAKP